MTTTTTKEKLKALILELRDEAAYWQTPVAIAAVGEWRALELHTETSNQLYSMQDLLWAE